jgi:hypothetical protein
LIIQPTSVAAQLWAGAAAGTTAAADAWRVGTLLTARVIGQNDIGKLLLDIGGMTVEADTTGTQLPSQFQVRVLTQGTQPQLEVVLAPTDERVALQGLRERLPQQNGYAPLLGALAALARSPVARSLPAPLRAALATLEASISRPDDVGTPTGMKEAIARSGVFLESQLAEPHAELPASDDFKAALMVLRRVLADLPATRAPGLAAGMGGTFSTGTGKGPLGALPRPLSDTPPPLAQRALVAQARADDLAITEDDVDTLVSQLRTDTRAALSRVEIAQLESHPQAGVWMVEVPLAGVRGYDVLQLRIEEGKAGPGEPEGLWTIGFAIDPPTLGAVQGEIQLRAPRVSVRLWADHGPTAARLENEFVPLRRTMEKSGLQLDHFSCIHGLPVPTSAYSAVLLEARA